MCYDMLTAIKHIQDIQKNFRVFYGDIIKIEKTRLKAPRIKAYYPYKATAVLGSRLGIFRL